VAVRPALLLGCLSGPLRSLTARRWLWLARWFLHGLDRLYGALIRLNGRLNRDLRRRLSDHQGHPRRVLNRRNPGGQGIKLGTGNHVDLFTPRGVRPGAGPGRERIGHSLSCRRRHFGCLGGVVLDHYDIFTHAEIIGGFPMSALPSTVDDWINGAWYGLLVAGGLALWLAVTYWTARYLSAGWRRGWRSGRPRRPQAPVPAPQVLTPTLTDINTLPFRGGGVCAVGHYVSPGALDCYLDHRINFKRTYATTQDDLRFARDAAELWQATFTDSWQPRG